MLLKAGHKLSLGTHLHPVGEEIKAEIEIGFKLYPEGARCRSTSATRRIMGIRVPMPTSRSTSRPEKSCARTATRCTRSRRRLIAFQPHMHTRGLYQCIELIYPSNPSKVMKREMINCAHWNYNWHLVYNYADDTAPLVPAGTIIHIISWHDNSANNRAQP